MLAATQHKNSVHARGMMRRQRRIWGGSLVCKSRRSVATTTASLPYQVVRRRPDGPTDFYRYDMSSRPVAYGHYTGG